MELNKKGIFFSLSGILLLAFLLGYLAVGFSSTSSSSVGSNNRLLVVDSFLDSIYEDGSFALETASFRTFLAMNDYISNTGLYIDDVELRLTESLTNETINSNSYPVLDNNSMNYWAQQMIIFAADFNIVAQIEFGDISITQNDPWFVDVTYDTNISLYDSITDATWNESRELSAKISIEGIYDPLYIIETNNQFTIYFEKTPFETFVQGTNVTNLTNHIEGQYYAQFDDAPSFLSRFIGSRSPGGSLGIESLVHKDVLSEAIPVDLSASNADYIYFSTSNTTIYDFTSKPDDFFLDNESNHIAFYNLTHLIK